MMQRRPGVIAREEADFVSLGRGALAHADWPARLRAGAEFEPFDRELLAPIADLANAARHRETVRRAAGSDQAPR